MCDLCKHLLTFYTPTPLVTPTHSPEQHHNTVSGHCVRDHHHQCVMGDTDLSAYELARLENIKQNRAALAALGLGGSASALTPIKKEKRKKEKAKRPRPPSSAPRTGQRQSRRLRSKTTDGSEEGHAREEEAEDAEEEEEEAEIVPQYVELLVFCSRPCGVWRVACG